MALKTTYEYITGKLSWVKPITPNPWGKWSITVHPNPESLAKINSWLEKGLRNKLSKDDDGYYMSFNRPTEKEYRGKLQGLQPPEVLDGSRRTEDGAPSVLRDVMVGNGSDGVVGLECYSWPSEGFKKAGMAARWLNVRVDNLIPFTIKRDFDKDQLRGVKGLEEQPVEKLF